MIFDEPQVIEEEVQEQEKRPRSPWVMWLIALAIAALFLPVYLISGSVGEAAAPLQAELESLQATLTAPPQVPAEEQALTERLLSARNQLSMIESAPATVVAGHTDWPTIMAAVLNYDANSIRLTGFSYANAPLTLVGNAVAESAVLEYANGLEASDLIERVSIQSIILSPPPTAVPDQTLDETPFTELNMPFVFTLSIELTRIVNGPG